MKRPLAVLAATLVLAQPLAAQGARSDSASVRHARSRPVLRLWEAGLLVGLTAGASTIDQSVRNEAQEDRTTFRNHLSDVGNAFGNGVYVYPVLVAATITGRLTGARGFEGVSLRALESTALAGAGDIVLKSLVGRKRPNISPNDPGVFTPFKFKDNSFPSGHTAVAFALATSLAQETRDHVSDVFFFSAATLTGFARINDDKHWLSDTVFGAGLGIVSARLVRRWNGRLLAGPGGVSASLSF